MNHDTPVRATILAVTLHMRMHNAYSYFTPAWATIFLSLHPRCVQILTVTLNSSEPISFQSLYIAACHNRSSKFTPTRANSFQLHYTGAGDNDPCHFTAARCSYSYSYFEPGWATILSVSLNRRASQSLQSLYTRVRDNLSRYFTSALKQKNRYRRV